MPVHLGRDLVVGEGLRRQVDIFPVFRSQVEMRDRFARIADLAEGAGRPFHLPAIDHFVTLGVQITQMRHPTIFRIHSILQVKKHTECAYVIERKAQLARFWLECEIALQLDVTAFAEGQAFDTGRQRALARPACQFERIDAFHRAGGAREPLMDTLIGHFQEANPCTSVINQVQPWDNRAELLATAAASSNPPGIIMSTRPETYQFAINGLIIPIDAFVEAEGTDLSVFYDGEIGIQYWNGELYGLPMPSAGGLTGMFLYNKDMLRDAGFDPENPPETWQELEEMAAAITVADAMGIDVLGASVGGGDTSFVSWLYTNGGQYVSDDGRTLLYNGPEGIETLEWMINFTNNINIGTENVADLFQDTSFAQGDHPWYEDIQAFLDINTSFFGHYNVNDPEGYADADHWGVMLRPYNGDNPDATHAGVTGYGFSGGWAYTIPAAHPMEKQAAAYKFAEWIGVNELGGCAFLFAQSRPSPVKACNENPAYFDVNPYWATVLEGWRRTPPCQSHRFKGSWRKF